MQFLHIIDKIRLMAIPSTLQSIIDTITGDNTLTRLYLTLFEHGDLTISRLSKLSGIERTHIYRSIDKLSKLQLIECIVDEKRQLYRSSPPHIIQHVLDMRAKEAENQRLAFTSITPLLTAKNTAATEVKFYSGISGIKQMLWNQTKAKSEIVSILSENIQSHTGEVFFKEWVDTCNAKNIPMRSVIDDNFIEQQIRWYGAFGHSLKNWSSRKLPESSSSIPHRTTIYDNVTTYFNWQDIDVFGIEIYNQSIADTQREYFELLWQKSTSLK